MDTKHEETRHPLAAGSAQRSTEEKPAPQIFDEADRIVIATPCYGGQMHFEHMCSVVAALTQVEARFRQKDGSVKMLPIIAERHYLDKESHIDRGRIKLANKFWRGEYNRLLFIDADIVFEPEHLATLWLHSMRGSKLVCAPYAMKGVVPQFAVNVAKGATKRDDGLVEVINAGTGFMMIHRDVFQTLIDQGRAEEYELGSNDPDYHTHRVSYDFFKSGVRKVRFPDGTDHKIWLSEDYMLCYEWQKCGGTVMMDYRLQLGHIGGLKFPVSAVEIVAAFKELRRINHPELPADPI